MMRFLPAAPAARYFCPLSDRRKRRRSETADWAAAICGVKADKIRELAQLFHENTTMLMAGWGMQRQQYGEQKHWMLVTLAAMLGQIGTPVADLVFPTILPTAAARPAARRAGLDAGSVAGGVDAVEKIRSHELSRRWRIRGRSISTTAWRGAFRYSLYLVGRRRQLYSSSGHQPTDSGVAETGAYRHFRMLLDRRRIMPISSCRRPPRLSVTI